MANVAGNWSIHALRKLPFNSGQKKVSLTYFFLHMFLYFYRVSTAPSKTPNNEKLYLMWRLWKLANLSA